VGFASQEQPMRKVLWLWFLATAVFLAGAMIWAFVPILVPIIGLTAALGVLVSGVVGLARWIERMRGETPHDG
jgi:hypothetical protein